ncbi:MAG TPA: dihydroorotate dehydrogenase [Bacteroidales bacterium]|nr:dihydroorotate dehydrogenase [Bacteroidales bacterium]HOU95649.1 dihydroorotate dehydrogenase [Bacteroidales bacterium]HQG36026.1 dihydroorotate dehydrogenase [Bacteroidales bacterium]HQG53168.1 dihydroorotate dehydrogenase [Bacteroidales bacterium]HQJ20342.1 dihydroorotate dehydrogenase [Bacteroidales bacterium]
MVNLSFKIGNLYFKNMVLTASGTCGYGMELEDFIPVEALGGIIIKGTTLEPREGNPYPRMAETASGMLNSVGLQNKGIDYFEKNIYPVISRYKTNVIVNINGNSIEDYVALAERINALDKINAIELNISCPNVKMGGMFFGTNPEIARKVIKEVRKVYTKILIVKLSPNVTFVEEFARIAEDEGADSISLINTLLGMAVDIRTMKPVLPGYTGGLSGPAIKPVALRMVWQASKAVKIPVIGIGGIMSANDALEFIMAGATAIQVGTAMFIDPETPLKIISGIEQFLSENNLDNYSSLIGCINT